MATKILVTRVQTWEFEDADHLGDEDVKAMIQSMDSDTEDVQVERIEGEQHPDGYKG